ncbi:MAG TPA: hypothetical protein VL137_18605, partial [Polyangiaceae bacterium]|nr:hypothetical protein [Polyangiaceae bacterium]
SHLPDGGETTDEPDSGAADAAIDAAPTRICGLVPVAGCVASPVNAVFVSGGVAHSGDGSQTAPVKTIAEGIAMARNDNLNRIVVCNGVYAEAVLVEVADSGRSLLGGYNCDSWIYNPEGETLIAPQVAGYALEISETTSVVTIGDLTFEAMAATDAGASSIAAFVHGPTHVKFNHVRLIAHEAMPAAAASPVHEFVAGVTDEWPAQVSLIGSDGLGHTAASSPTFVGGARVSAVCPGGAISRSGKGGGQPDVAPGEAGLLPVGKGGSGGAIATGCDTCDSGICGCVASLTQAGQRGEPGADGAGAAVYGALEAVGWRPAAGQPGEIGMPGGGGGGGDGAWQACGVGGDQGWYGGGSGGAGGCGGNAGSSGNGGGASIALLALNATLNLTNCELHTADAGAGSSGNSGQEGQLGGAGGAGISSSSFSVPCGGGAGGSGGHGGHGGGGAGGISVGLVWTGAVEPTVDQSTQFTLGQPGAGGANVSTDAGSSDAGSSGGISGVAQDILQVPAL